MQAAIQIREAQEDDSGPISVLMAEMGHPLEAETVSANLRAMRALAPLYGTFVAVMNSSVVGVVSAFASAVLHRPHPVGRISVLVVTRAFAGQGIGSALLLQAETFLRELGCGRLEVTSASHRQEAHEFYRRRGYTQQGVRFAREFDGQRLV
jgi:GNAT superfamily N-acetyltransferase